MLLSLLLDRVRPALGGVSLVRGDGARVVGLVTDRDGDVREGDVFVAIRGARVDGHDRLAGLSRAGCVVVERDVPVPPGPAVVRVADSRRALAWLAAARLDFPGAAMRVVGITGTNGKTSTTFLVAAMAQAAGWKTGIIGTTGHFIDASRVETKFTTPTAPDTQALLASMRDAGCKLVAMEVSSIGLAAFRADGIPFAAGVFTNLTRDHLDYHGTMEAYAAAKRRLFTELLTGPAILNADGAGADGMVPEHGEVWWTGVGPGERRTVWADGVEAGVRLSDGILGTRARFHTPMGEFDGEMHLIGRHNLENALGALGGALAAGVPLEACAVGLATLRCVPGRMEPVPNARGLDVYVDYAHTDDALVHVLGTLRALRPRRILTVFGCGGDRDRGKRPLMGRAAAAGSEVVYITSDNPRTEDPERILDDIVPGLGAAPFVREPDRARAIARALADARPGDIVLIAGKGHESTQTIGDVIVPFDDREVAGRILAGDAPIAPTQPRVLSRAP